MSTTKKKTIKFTALMTVLILTVTYFSLLTPTSAYFYTEIGGTKNEINFALFQVNNGDENILSEIQGFKFKGATKFADFDEKLFDEVAEEITYTVTNTGEVPAKVITRVTPLDNSETNGLKYMIVVSDPYSASTEPEAVSEEAGETTTEEASSTTETTTEIPKGELKSEIESRLGLSEDISYSDAVSILNAYNEENNHTRVLQAGTTESTTAGTETGETTLSAGQSIDVRIIFWAEYDEAMSKAGGEEAWQDAQSIASIDYSCKIEMIASQLNDEAVAKALETTEAETTTVTEADS